MNDVSFILPLAKQAIVAPAGHGKTEVIARASALGRRALVLTHTHAGVHVIKARLKRLGISPAVAAVDTIAGWATRYAYAFPGRANPPVGVPRGADWNRVYEGAAAILGSPAVRRVIEASYDRILIDEYQDCDGLQHEIALGLARILPTVIFGDPMQGIFEFAPSRIAWHQTVGPAFPEAGTLDTPHRWREANPELGRWIADTRQRLMRGDQIDLRDGPIKYRQSDDIFDMGLFFEGLDDRVGSTAAIHCRRPLCNNLAKATRGAFQSIEEIAASRLIVFAEAWDAAVSPADRKRALMALVADVLTETTEDPEQPDDPMYGSAVQDAWDALEQSGSEADAIRLLAALRARPRNRAFRAELLNDARRALAEVENGRQPLLVDASQSMRSRLSQTGRAPVKRTVSTPLLLKGLEFDHVLLPDITHFSREIAAAKLFYVAISRARLSLTIAAPSPVIHFAVPNL